MKTKIKKVWFQKGKAWECYACEPPYKKENIIKEGVKYEVWIKLDTYNGGD